MASINQMAENGGVETGQAMLFVTIEDLFYFFFSPAFWQLSWILREFGLDYNEDKNERMLKVQLSATLIDGKAAVWMEFKCSCNWMFPTLYFICVPCQSIKIWIVYNVSNNKFRNAVNLFIENNAVNLFIDLEATG